MVYRTPRFGLRNFEVCSISVTDESRGCYAVSRWSCWQGDVLISFLKTNFWFSFKQGQLIHMGKVLEEGKPISEYGVSEGQVVYCIDFFILNNI